MININIILKSASRYLFFDLEDADRNILNRLAKDGPQNLSELGGYNRGNRKRRLYGSPGTLGLIPNGFVYEFKVNKKEKNYDLTVKGLLAVLATTKFEDVDMVKRYKTFLWKKIKKKKLLGWSLEFIKYEITLILYYNHIQGLNWTRFKNIKSYWTDYKSYSGRIVRTFFMHRFSDKNMTNKYDMIENRYLTLFSILDYCTFFMDWGLDHSFNELSAFSSDRSFRIYIDRWFSFIDEPNLFKRNLDELINEWNDSYENNSLDFDDFFSSKIRESKREAHEILKRNGYDVKLQ